MPTLGFGILSWKSPQTLVNTLESYTTRNFFSHFDESLIYFQEISDEDRKIAKKHGLSYAGGPQNLGIQGGMKKVAENLHTDYFAYAENDLYLDIPKAMIKQQLSLALTLLQEKKADVVRLRRFEELTHDRHYHRYFPAKGSSALTHALALMRRIFFPHTAARRKRHAVYMEPHPEKLYPSRIQKIATQTYIVDSSLINWSNCSFMCRRQWFLETLIPFAESHPAKKRQINHMQDLEGSMDEYAWWQNQHFKVAIIPGILKHERLDR